MDPNPGSRSAGPSGSLRRLLPARPASLQPAPELSSSASQAAKRRQIPAACEACRKRKTKCSGDRPKCYLCVSRQIECFYSTSIEETRSQAVKRRYNELETRKTDLERIYQALQLRSEADAQAVLLKIRRGDDLEVIARHIDFGDLLIQVSLQPETKYRYEFPFISSMPTHLLHSWNPYLQSMIYEWTSGSADGRSVYPGHSRHGSSSKSLSPTLVETYAPYLKPYHASEVISHQLNSVEPSRWTTVCTDNALMTKLLRAYFLQEHDWHTFFQKDYFLQDMAKMRRRFCSPLLVNALLATACHCYRPHTDRAEFWNPRALSYRFLAEAKRLWELERDVDRITTVQAALLLNHVYNMSGADKLGWDYTIQAVRMAQRLNLFKASNDPKGSMKDARDFTAWVVFSWQSVLSFLFFYPPLLDRPPKVPLPYPPENPRWYGELYLRYPLNHRLYPAHFGDLFKAKADFHVILNELCCRLFPSTPSPEPISDTEAAEFYSRFKAWYQGLPDSLSPRKIVLPDHIKLHIEYYHVLTSLLKSFTSAEPSGLERSRVAEPLFGGSPDQLFFEAKVCSETLIRIYYLRHGFDFLDSSLLTFIPPLIFMSVDDIETHRRHDSPYLPTMQSTAILLCKALYDQGKSYYLPQVIFRLIRDRMHPDDSDMVRRFARVEELPEIQGKDDHDREVRSSWPVGIISVMDDPEAFRLNTLLDHYKEASTNSSSGTENS